MIKNFLYYGAKVESPNFFDRILSKTFLKLIPQSVTPNQITVFRYLSIPVVLYLLISNFYYASLVAFSISAFSDAVDGALARTRGKITDWGKMHDPMADKLLIGSVGAILITKYISFKLLYTIIAIELILVIFALYRKRFGHKVISALLPGKIKMVLQSVALILILVYTVSPSSVILLSAEFLLYGAIFFALISLFVYRSI